MSEQTEETILQVDGEQRNCEVSEIRAVGNGPLPRLVGYAAKFNIVSQDFGAGFREKILPGAFAPALAVDREVLAIVGHDFNQPLGRRSAGTLKLREDNVGLYFEIDPPDTAIGRDAVENVRRGDIKGASFRFNNAKDSWGRNADGDRVRTISSFGILREISLTTIPAHESTEVAVGTLPTFKRESEPTNDDRQQQLESQEQLLAAGAEEVRRDRLRDAEQKLRSDIGYDAIDAEADEADFQERRRQRQRQDWLRTNQPTSEQREQRLREAEASIPDYVPPGMVVHYTLDHQRFLIPKRGR